MEFELIYKDFQENCNIIDGYYHYDELNQYISENFYKLPFSASDVYMEDSIPKLEIDKDKDKGFMKIGKTILNALITLVNLVLKLVAFVITFVLDIITKFSSILRQIAIYLKTDNYNDIIKDIGKIIDGEQSVKEDDQKKIGALLSNWYDSFKDLNIINNIKTGVTDITASITTPQNAVVKSSVQYDFTNNNYSYYKESSSMSDKELVNAFKKYLDHQRELVDTNFNEQSDIFIFSQGLIYLSAAITYLSIIEFINDPSLIEFREDPSILSPILSINEGKSKLHEIIESLNKNEFNAVKSIYPILLYKYNNDNKTVPDKLKSNMSGVVKASSEIYKLFDKVHNNISDKGTKLRRRTGRMFDLIVSIFDKIKDYPSDYMDIKNSYNLAKKMYESIDRKSLTSNATKSETPKSFKFIFKLIKDAVKWIKMNKAIITENKNIYKQLNETKKVCENLKKIS